MKRGVSFTNLIKDYNIIAAISLTVSFITLIFFMIFYIPNIVKIVFILIGMVFLMIGTIKTFSSKGVLQNQIFILVGSILILYLGFSSNEVIIKNPTDYFLIGSVSFIVATFLFDHSSSSNELRFVILSTISSVVFFLAGLLQVLTGTFQTQIQNVVISNIFIVFENSLIILGSINLVSSASYFLDIMVEHKKGKESK